MQFIITCFFFFFFLVYNILSEGEMIYYKVVVVTFVFSFLTFLIMKQL